MTKRCVPDRAATALSAFLVPRLQRVLSRLLEQRTTKLCRLSRRAGEMMRPDRIAAQISPSLHRVDSLSLGCLTSIL